MGDLTLVEPYDLIVAELSSIMTLLLEYFGECTIRVTACSIRVSRSHISICDCLLFCNLLILDPILLSFGKDYFAMPSPPTHQFSTRFSLLFA